MKIKKASYVDLISIAEIEAAVYDYEGAWSLESYQEDFKLPDRYYLIAEDNYKVIGYGICCVNNGVGELVANTVLPEYRGQGIGKQLLKYRLEWLSDKCSEVIAQINPDNIVSKNLLKNNGFVFSKVLENYYGVGRDAYEFIYRRQNEPQ